METAASFEVRNAPSSYPTVAADARSGEVRLCRSSCEAAEQSRVTGSGGGGAKGRDQGERGSAKHAPDADPGARDPGAEPRTASRKAKEEGAVHRASPPCQRRHAPDGVLRAQTQSRRRCRRGDMAGLRGGPRARISRTSTGGSTGERIGRNHLAGRTYRRRMVGNGRWRSQLWKTRSSRAHAPWCSTPSTKRISSGSHTGSDLDEGHMMRWTLCRWRSPAGR